MQVLEFNYTKDNGNVSHRVLHVVHPADNFHTGYDLSELDPELMQDYANAVNEAVDNFKDQMTRIAMRFDLKHSYKRFDPLKMTNVTSEHI